MPREGSPAQYYRDQATRIRAIAADCKLPEIKQQLLTIADQFDRLAAQHAKGIYRSK